MKESEKKLLRTQIAIRKSPLTEAAETLPRQTTLRQIRRAALKVESAPVSFLSLAL